MGISNGNSRRFGSMPRTESKQRRLASSKVARRGQAMRETTRIRIPRATWKACDLAGRSGAKQRARDGAAAPPRLLSQRTKGSQEKDEEDLHRSSRDGGTHPTPWTTEHPSLAALESLRLLYELFRCRYQLVGEDEWLSL